MKKIIFVAVIAGLLAGCAPLAPTHDYRIDASYNDYQAWKGHGPLQHNERCKWLTEQGKCDAGQWPVTGQK